MSEVNFLVFLCDAFGQNSEIYNEIDQVYKKRKYEYYRLAQGNSELYDHPLIKEGSLLHEEYSKKSLGIMLYQQEHLDDIELKQEIDFLVKKGWPYVYTYAKKEPKIAFGKFIRNFAKKRGGLNNLTDDDFCCNLAVLIVMALSMEKPFIEDRDYQVVIHNFYERAEHFNHVFRIDEQKRPKIQDLKNQIFATIGQITNYESLLDCQVNNVLNQKFALLFDREKLTPSIFHGMEFTSKDVDEIIDLCNWAYPDCDSADLDKTIDFYIAGLYLKYLMKCYKQVKEHYFKNNKETQFVELEQKDKEIIKLSEKLAQKEAAEANAANQMDQLTKKVERLTAQLGEEQLKNNELNSLREFVFELDSQVEYQETPVDFEELKKVKAVILGGHERWQAKMKEHLPECIFIRADMIHFDPALLQSVEDIFIYVNYLNHKIYYKLMENVKGKNKNIYYLNQQNETLVLMAIQQKLHPVRG